MASRRHDPTQRSAIAFIRGTPGRIGTTRAPTAVKTASKPSVKYPALSRIRYRMPAVCVVQAHHQGAGLLGGPLGGDIAGDAGNVHATGAVLAEEQDEKTVALQNGFTSCELGLR